MLGATCLHAGADILEIIKGSEHGGLQMMLIVVGTVCRPCNLLLLAAFVNSVSKHLAFSGFITRKNHRPGRSSELINNKLNKLYQLINVSNGI